MGKGFLTYLICNLSIFCFCSCGSNDKEYVQLKKELKKQYGVSLGTNIKRIFVINDVGCGNCTLLFSGYIKDYVQDEASLILVHSRGYNVDLEAFQAKAKEKPEVFISYQTLSDPENRFYLSSVYYLNGEQLDTVIYIKPELLKEQLFYISERK